MVNLGVQKQTFKQTRKNELCRDEIAKLAFELYEKRGAGEGQALEDWLEAERILRTRIRKNQ